MTGEVKEEVSCCFNILTAITHWGYRVLKIVPEFAINYDSAEAAILYVILILWLTHWGYRVLKVVPEFAINYDLAEAVILYVILILWYHWHYK